MERSPAEEQEDREGVTRALARAGIVAQVVLPKDEQVILRGMRFHYLDWGGGGRPVVFLHGGGLNAHTYDLACLALRDTYRCYSLDARGHGDSEWSPVMDYDMATQAEDVRAFATHLGLTDFVLVGMSMGGNAALVYASDHSATLAGLVIVDIGPELQEKGTKRIREFMTMPSELDSIDQYVTRAKAFNPMRDEVILRRTLRKNLRQTPAGKWVWKYDTRHRTRGTIPDHTDRTGRLWQAVDRITAPTLVVRGGKSDVFSPEAAVAMTARLADGRLETVPDAGHTVQGDNPKGFVDVLRRFLAEVAPAR